LFSFKRCRHNKILSLSVDEALDKLSKAKEIIGHNIIKFDIPVIKKLYPNFKTEAKIFDTLVATRLLFPDVKEKDFQRKDFPKDCIGRHSLKAWGNRIGNYKAEFDTDWKTFTPEMLEYCKQDVEVTYNLYKMIHEDMKYSQQAMDLEHDVAQLIYNQEVYGFSFNTDKAKKLYSELNGRRMEIEYNYN
jgi:DNA polymerase-1